MYKKIALSLCFTLFLGLLSACSPDGFLHLKSANQKNESSKENTKNTPGKPSKTPTSIGTPVALPPEYTGIPIPRDNNSSGTNLSAFRPMKGINLDAMFNERIKDSDKRFKRVEDAVLDLRKEFEAFKPSIIRLSAVESDIQNLVKELDVLLQETPIPQSPVDLTNGAGGDLNVGQLDLGEGLNADDAKAQPIPPPAVPTPTVQKAKVKTPPPKASPPKQSKHYDYIAAQNLRIGEHSNKVRVVIDSNKKTKFSVDLDNDEKLIIIEMPDAKWVGSKSKSFAHGKLVKSMEVEELNGGKGSMIILSLKKGTSIMKQSQLKPDSTSAYHRVYFDLSL